MQDLYHQPYPCMTLRTLKYGLLWGHAGFISSTVTRTLSPKSLASNSRFESLGSCLGLLGLGFRVWGLEFRV